MKLLRFDEIQEKAYITYIEAWEKEDSKIIPSSANRNGLDFPSLLKKWQHDETEAVVASGFVPSTLYFLEDEAGQLVGSIHFRHRLNQRLIENGGHIGYGVKPGERRKGHASTMLALLLEMLREKGYDKVMLTCDDENTASGKTIEKAKGILQDKVPFEGVLTRRYWISLV